jgi:hypothetical protein
MAFTNFSSSILNYGPSLPSGQVPDGMMFHLTSGATGLYVYNFAVDSNSSTAGDQVGQGWRLLASTGLLNADFLNGHPSTDFQLVDGDLTAISILTGVGFAVRLGTDSWATRSFVAGNGVTLSNTNGSSDITISVNTGSLNLNSLSGILDIAHGGTGNNVAAAGAVAYGAGSSIAYTSVGSTGQFLQSNGTSAPTWSTGSLTIGSTTISLGTTATVIAGLSQITAGTFIGTLSGNATSSTTATNIGGGAAGSIPYQTSANTTALLPVGTANYVLAAGAGPNYIPYWTSPASFVAGAASSVSITDNQLSGATWYPTFVAAAGGYQAPDVDTAKLTYVPSTGTLSATVFSGTATLASNATLAVKASTLAQNGGNGAGMTFNWAGQLGQPSWLWGSNDGITTNVYNPSNFSVAFATKASTLAQGGGTGTAMTFNYAGQIGQPTYLWGTNDGTTTNVWNPSSFVVANTNSISNAVGNSYVWTALQTFNAGLISLSSISAAGGAGNLSRVVLQPGTNGISGAIDFYSVIGREGYIGRSTSVQSADGGTIPYVAGVHAFTGDISIGPSMYLVSSTGTFVGTNVNVTANVSANGAITAIGLISSSSTISAGGNISSGGTITAAGDVIAYSDARTKTDVVTIQNALETVQSLRGVNYTRLSDGEASSGVIAQEVLAVMPQVVREQADGYLGVAYGNMVGVLIEAIKEQQKQIDALREQVKLLASSSSP